MRTGVVMAIIMPRSPHGASLKHHGFTLLRYFRRIFY